MTCHYVMTIGQIMLLGQLCKWYMPLYPATSFTHMHALQSKALPTVVPALVELAFLALSAVIHGVSSLAAPGGSSALASPLKGTVLVGCWQVACTAAGSGLAPVTAGLASGTRLLLALCAGVVVT